MVNRSKKGSKVASSRKLKQVARDLGHEYNSLDVESKKEIVSFEKEESKRKVALVTEQRWMMTKSQRIAAAQEKRKIAVPVKKLHKYSHMDSLYDENGNKFEVDIFGISQSDLDKEMADLKDKTKLRLNAFATEFVPEEKAPRLGPKITRVENFARDNFLKFGDNYKAAKAVMEKKEAAARERNKKLRAHERLNEKNIKILKDLRIRNKELLVEESTSLPFKAKKIRSRPSKAVRSVVSKPVVMEEKKQLPLVVTQIDEEKVSSNVVKYSKEESKLFRLKIAELRTQKKNNKILFNTQGGTVDDYNLNFVTKCIDSIAGQSNVLLVEWVVTFMDMLMFFCTEESAKAKAKLFKYWLRLQGVRLIESEVYSLPLKFLLSKQKQPIIVSTQTSISESLDTFGDVLEYTFDSMFADSLKNLFISMA